MKIKLNEGPTVIKQIQIQNIDVCKETPNIWNCFNMFILAQWEDSLTMCDINNFIDFVKCLCFSLKQMAIEISVLGFMVVYLLVKFYFQGAILNKFKMHSEDEEKQKHTADGNSHNIAATSQGHELENKQ